MFVLNFVKKYMIVLNFYMQQSEDWKELSRHCCSINERLVRRGTVFNKHIFLFLARDPVLTLSLLEQLPTVLLKLHVPSRTWWPH